MNISQHHSLREVAVFRELSGCTISALEARCTWRTFERGEQTVSREKTITLTGGENQVVSFETETPRVASVN